MKKFVFIVISASLLGSCNVDDIVFDDIKVPTLTPVFSFPLGETTYVMRDILGKQTGDSLNLQEDSTSLLTLLYYDTISYGASNDFVQINDIVENGAASAPVSPAGSARTVPINQSFDLAYSPQGDELLDSVFYETGNLTMTTTSTLSGTLNYSYTISNTSTVDTNTPVVLSGSINGIGTDTQSQDLSNYKTKLTGGSNTFSVILEATVDLAATDELTGNEQITFDLVYGNQTFSLIYGKFGQDFIQVGNQSIDLDFFSQAAREGITFGNPKMTFDFTNSFGIPVEADFSGLVGDDGSGGNQIALKGDIVNNPPLIEGSDVNSPTPTTQGEAAQSTIEINRSNSNIVALLGSNPSRLTFGVAGTSNPTDPTQLNYLQPESQINTNVAIEIPMEVQLDNLTETGSFDLGNGIDLSDVDSAFIRIVTINELPFSGIVDLEVQDEDSTTLYSIADNLVLSAPFINVNGEVTDPNGNTTDIPISPEGIDAFANGSHILITLRLSTPQSQTSREIYVKILADYTLTLKVGLGGKLKVDL
ncbi:hypothetical protein [Ekhidna lutea]|uniref:hypothetical protein n=1 Tax=Ekhidna lutea TaxID=447679 RepID=UPI00117E3316|nr:hypothetical protein [Ekhidna lutea]